MPRAEATAPGRRAAAGLVLGSAALAVLLAAPVPVRAQSDPCPGAGVPGKCQPQVQAPITYRGWQTQGWAYYCTGDHPYFWGLSTSHSGSYSFDNSCFTVAENMFAENGCDDKFDALITNWCVTTQQLTVTLACSDTPFPVPPPRC